MKIRVKRFYYESRWYKIQYKKWWWIFWKTLTRANTSGNAIYHLDPFFPNLFESFESAVKFARTLNERKIQKHLFIEKQKYNCLLNDLKKVENLKPKEKLINGEYFEFDTKN